MTAHEAAVVAGAKALHEAGVVGDRMSMAETVVSTLAGYVVQALAQLDDEHRPDPELKGRGGCVMCWPKDGSWPCVTRLIADELRVLFAPETA